jgi:hypothetical protein
VIAASRSRDSNTGASRLAKSACAQLNSTSRRLGDQRPRRSGSAQLAGNISPIRRPLASRALVEGDVPRVQLPVELRPPAHQHRLALRRCILSPKLAAPWTNTAASIVSGSRPRAGSVHRAFDQPMALTRSRPR